MAKNPYPRPGHETSLSGKPKAFKHVKKIGPEFNMASTGEREKAKLRNRAPKMKKAFRKAHEGPREKLDKPRLHNIHTPTGKVVAKVHSKVDREKRARNRQKDMQMKKWRERKIAPKVQKRKPKQLLRKNMPDIFMGAARKHALKQQLQQKRIHSRGGQGR